MNFVIPGQGKVIAFYGEDAQAMVHAEELAELIQAVSKARRTIGAGHDIPPDVYNNLVEEVADTLICLEQIIEMYEIPGHAIQSMIFRKVVRQEDRMNA